MIEITSDFQLQTAQQELSELMQQSIVLNTQRIIQLQQAIDNYLMKK